MSDDDLAILVVAYDDVDAAKRAFTDLAAARRDNRVRHYVLEAAQSRQRRIRLPLEHADITLPKKELQDPGYPPTVPT